MELLAKAVVDVAPRRAWDGDVWPRVPQTRQGLGFGRGAAVGGGAGCDGVSYGVRRAVFG